ncbi:Diacylglycerol O-acyltransferase 1 [Sarcoptes scabiei]|uniref:O-acyltransferase n=1 Tax=Sarcoptes scabiei TaxID=52283 RepID=A0A834VF15_SARSC|nr:Diacylglycerol O-acyltransferase 1 [Sarcoptes scabiei]
MASCDMKSNGKAFHKRTKNQNFGDVGAGDDDDQRNYYDDLLQAVHKNRDSLFTSSSGYTNYRGLFNLCYIILVLSNFRVALENILKYGILVDPLRLIGYFFTAPNLRSLFGLLSILNLFIVISLHLERYLFKNRQSNHWIFIHLAIELFTPIIAFNYFEFNPIAASVCCVFYSMIFLKLVSYHMVNYWCRMKLIIDKQFDSFNQINGLNRSDTQSNPIQSLCDNKNDKDQAVVDGIEQSKQIQYPNNLNLKDIYYFMVVPTLCYELNFPRTRRIRKTFLIKRFLEIILLFQLQIGFCQQWIWPAIQNSLEPFMEMSFSKMLERLLKLAVPNHLCWQVFFYLYFHSILNLIGELTRFADREFYRDWWNSESVEYFWKTWNIPVHRWCVRHVYLPLLSYKLSSKTASLVVFLISAFFHEYLVSVPLNMYRIWAFMGMIANIPYAIIVRKLNKNVANFAVWLLLIIGQPLCILMYYHDFYVIHMAQNQSLASNHFAFAGIERVN